MRPLLILLLFMLTDAWSQAPAQDSLCDGSVLAQELNVARTLLYYSMFTSNSRGELELVQDHLNASERLLDCPDLSVPERNAAKRRWDRMQRDVRSRLDVGMENLNYKLPLYDVMYGHRKDLNTVDDFVEIAVEGLCEDILHQPSDYRSLWEVPSIHSWVVFDGNSSDELHNVAIEFLSEQSNQYVIQLMEYPESYFQSGGLSIGDSLLRTNARTLSDSFGLDRLYVFAFDEIATVLDSTLTYWGTHVLKYSRTSDSIEPLLYLERFKADRNTAFAQSFLIVLCLTVLAMFMLLVHWNRKVNPDFEAIRNKAVHLIGVVGIFVVLLGGVLYLGRTYGAQPSAFAGEAIARLSEMLFAVLLPAFVLALVRIYRTVIQKGVEREVDLFLIYAFALILLPISLCGFAFFKAPNLTSVAIIMLSGISLLPVAALIARSLHRNRLNIADGIHRWLALAVATVSVFTITLFLQRVPECADDVVKLCSVSLISLAIWIRQGQTKSAPNPEIQQHEVNASSLHSYPELFEGLQQLAKSKEAFLGLMRYERGWGKTTIRDEFALAFLGQSAGQIFQSSMLEFSDNEAGHVYLSRSIRKESPDAANIIFDPGAAESLQWAQRISQTVLSFFADADPTDAFEKLRRFNPEVAAAGLLDYLASTYSKTVYWWIDDFDLLDKNGRTFILECFKKSNSNRLKDGSLPLKVILAGVTVDELEPEKRSQWESFEATCAAVGMVHHRLGNNQIKKRALLSDLLKAKFQGVPLASSSQEKLKDLFEPFIDDRALSFNLNAANGLVEHLIGEHVLVSEYSPRGNYGREENAEQAQWCHDERIDQVDFPSIISLLSNEVREDVAFDREAARTLELAAAIGMGFDVRVVRLALDRPHLEVMDHLSEAEEAGVIWDDPNHDHVFHFRSTSFRKRFFQIRASKMSQRERDVIRITGSIAEELFENNQSEHHLLQIAADQFWLLREIPQYRSHAIALHKKLLELLEDKSHTREQSVVLERLCALEPDSLAYFSDLLAHELNTQHVLSPQIFDRALGYIRKITIQDEIAASICLNLITSACRRGKKKWLGELENRFNLLVPSDAEELMFRAKFTDVYWKANLRDDDGRKRTVHALQDLASQIDPNKSPQLRSLKGEILNATSGILIDRMTNYEEGLKVLLDRFHLFPGQTEASLEVEISRFFHQGDLNAITMKEFTPSERKSLAMALNYTVRALFALKTVTGPILNNAILLNRYASEYVGELIALNYAAWHKVLRQEFDAELVRLTEQYFRTATQGMSPKATDYLNVLALTLTHRANSVLDSWVSPTIVSSCLNRFQALFEDPFPSSQRIHFTPPGQTKDLIAIILDALSSGIGQGETAFGLDQGQLEILYALDFRNRDIHIPAQTKKHLLRHYEQLTTEEMADLLSELPTETEANLRDELGLPGSSFLKDGPLASMSSLAEVMEREIASGTVHLDVLTVLEPGVYRLGFGLRFPENVGYQGIVRITPERAPAVRRVDRGGHVVPVIDVPAELTPDLHFVVKLEQGAKSMELITAYAGIYAPPFKANRFWKEWALISR